MLFFTIPQTESGAIIVILLGFFILPFILKRIRKYRERKKYFLSNEEYAQEGLEKTKQSIEELIYLYKKNPQFLQKLAPNTQKRVLAFMEE